jgi:hypothetical protein
MTPGAWAGSLLRSDDGQVRILNAQDKWEKAKALIKETQELLVDDADRMPQKRLEQIRGFLNYVCQTYPILSSYLIGYHMTIDSWRQGRDEEGWRLHGKALQKAAERADWAPSIGYIEGPQVVRAVPRFWSDLEALEKLTESPTSPLRRIHCRGEGRAFYGFGDASGPGFGASIQIGDWIEFEYGQWSSEITEEASSNW